MQGSRGITSRCYGPACPRRRPRLLGGLYQEWPTYTQFALPLQLAKYRPDVVHSTSHLGPLWGPGQKVVTVHDVIFERYPQDYNPAWLAVTRALFPKVLAGASAIIADSRSTATDLETLYGVQPNRITVIYPGVDEGHFAPAPTAEIEATRRKYGLGDGPYVLCLGPWVRRKNIGVVIAAFASLVERLPDVKLVITGRRATGMTGFDLEKALEQSPERVRHNVRAVGHLPRRELRALLQGASALAYPSLFEGFGLPPLEAMAAGVPVVASDAPAVVEATGDAALIAGANAPADWAEALYQIITDGTKTAQLREAGKQRSRSFTWERCAGETVDLYDRIVRQSEGNQKSEIRNQISEVRNQISEVRSQKISNKQ